MAVGKAEHNSEAIKRRGAAWRTWALAFFPLLLLVALVYYVLASGETILGRPPVPVDALQRLEFQRVVLRPGRIVAQVINTGPGPVTIGQVTVNEAIWGFSVSPGGLIPRLGRARVIIPYPWHQEEPLNVTLITSAGLKFERSIAIAIETPSMGLRSIGYFSLIGTFAGVIPVYLGLLWLPFLRRIGQAWMNFLVSFTAGILLALGVDVMVEAIEAAGRVGTALRGGGVVTFGLLAGMLALAGVEQSVLRGSPAEGAAGRVRERLVLAYLISVGIGLHNFGEGVAIGSAYVLGDVALGALLIVGFMVHNSTEGFAIVAPVSKGRVAWPHFVAMGFLTSAPTVLGTIVGGFAYFDSLAALFFAIGGGAIFYVIYQLLKDLVQNRGQTTMWPEVAGVLGGVALMYVTGLLVAV